LVAAISLQWGRGLLLLSPRRYAKPTSQDVIPNRAAGAVRNLLSHMVDCAAIIKVAHYLYTLRNQFSDAVLHFFFNLKKQ
jgi:predicted metallo-beta-lactamase superfamily hydrolase